MANFSSLQLSNPATIVVTYSVSFFVSVKPPFVMSKW
jgi:hypothetical protein